MEMREEKTPWETTRQEPTSYEEMQDWVLKIKSDCMQIEQHLATRRANIDEIKAEGSSHHVALDVWSDYSRWRSRAIWALRSKQKALNELNLWSKRKWPHGGGHIAIGSRASEPDLNNPTIIVRPSAVVLPTEIYLELRTSLGVDNEHDLRLALASLVEEAIYHLLGHDKELTTP